MKEKYEKWGKFAGSLKFVNLSNEEKEQLSGFLGRDLKRENNITITMKQMEKALEKSRFRDVTWKQILETYYGKELVIKKELLAEKQYEKEKFFQDIVEKYSNKKGKKWFLYLMEVKKDGYRTIIQQYEKNKEELSYLLKNIFLAIKEMPVFYDDEERLPVFSTKITGNPHFFDDGTIGNQLLLSFLNYYFGKEMGKKSKAEEKNYLMYLGGILIDDLSNHVLVYGINGITKYGEIHQGLEGYYREKEPHYLTLQTLQKLKFLQGNPNVYIIENPSVFSLLIEKYPDISIICTNGNIRISTWYLLDHLRAKTFFYNGDFDPEGLYIAQKLKERYKDKLYLWRYTKENYESAMSSIQVSESRIRILNNIVLEELEEVKEKLLIKKMAAYQEAMNWDMIEIL